MANSKKEEVTLPKYMEDTSLAEIIREIAELNPDELQWQEDPIAEGEQVIGQASDYQKRLYTLQKIAEKRCDELRQETAKYLLKNDLEKIYRLSQEERLHEQKALICSALLCVDIIEKYDSGIRSSGEGLRADDTIVSLPMSSNDIKFLNQILSE